MTKEEARDWWRLGFDCSSVEWGGGVEVDGPCKLHIESDFEQDWAMYESALELEKLPPEQIDALPRWEESPCGPGCLGPHPDED